MNSNSNRKIKPERMKTPSHLNSSEYVFKNSATKKFSPNLSRRPCLNETVGFRPGQSLDPKFKTKLSNNCEVNYEVEYDMAYNDYLQAQMKKQFVAKKVEEYKQILGDQLLIQNENLYKRQQNLKDIVVDTESFQTKSEIVQMIEYLQEKFISFANICVKYNMKTQLNQFTHALNLECDKVILRNIKVLGNQQEYEKLMHSLESCLTATQKIINSGRNFEEVHSLAESIRNLTDLIDNVQKSQQTVSELENEAMYNFLQNVSDFFARRYNEHSC